MNKEYSLYRWLIAVVLLSAALVGCSGSFISARDVETINDKLAYLEISYSEVYKQAVQYGREGRLSKNQAVELNKLLDRMEEARLMAKITIKLGTAAEASDELTAATLILQQIRALFLEVDNER